MNTYFICVEANYGDLLVAYFPERQEILEIKYNGYQKKLTTSSDLHKLKAAQDAAGLCFPGYDKIEPAPWHAWYWGKACLDSHFVKAAVLSGRPQYCDKKISREFPKGAILSAIEDIVSELQ